MVVEFLTILIRIPLSTKRHTKWIPNKALSTYHLYFILLHFVLYIVFFKLSGRNIEADGNAKFFNNSIQNFAHKRSGFSLFLYMLIEMLWRDYTICRLGFEIWYNWVKLSYTLCTYDSTPPNKMEQLEATLGFWIQGPWI